MHKNRRNVPYTLTPTGTLVVRPLVLDCGEAAQVREQLLILLNRGASGLLVDLSDCAVVCPCCGAPALVRAYRRARALGAGFEVIAPSSVVARRPLDRARRTSQEPFPAVSEPEAA
ncbi:STAS domain-containing protein [Streptomyces sp. NPDC017993]|uniref:STAS domain-containing protein n=1 Tax=Streptomyces sp. NPDC017993 TaxID=3365027 RepID=UPI0037B2CE87